MRSIIYIGIVLTFLACKDEGEQKERVFPEAALNNENATPCKEQKANIQNISLCSTCSDSEKRRLLEDALLKQCDSKKIAYALFANDEKQQGLVDCKAFEKKKSRPRFIEFSADGQSITLSSLINLNPTSEYCTPATGTALRAASAKLCNSSERRFSYQGAAPSNVAMIICQDREDPRVEAHFSSLAQTSGEEITYRFEALKKIIVVRP